MATTPVYNGPMKYRPTEEGYKKVIHYLGYNWYLCTKHLKAVKKIQARANENLPKSLVWNKTYHKVMAITQIIPFIGHIVAGLEVFLNRLNLDRSWRNLEDKPTDFVKPKDLNRQAFEQCIQNPSGLTADLKSNKWVAFDIVEHNGLNIQIFDQEIKKNFPIALKAVSQNIEAFHLIDDSLKENPDFLLACIELKGKDFFDKFVPPSFKNSYPFCLRAISVNSFIYESLPGKFMAQKQIILAMFTQPAYDSKNSFLQKENAALFKLIPKSLCDDSKFIKQILQRNGLVLEHLDESFKDDWKSIHVAVKNNYHAYLYASEKKRQNSALLLSLIKINPDVFEDASEIFKINKCAAGIILEKNPIMYQFLDPSLQKERDIFVMALSKCGEVFAHAPKDFRGDVNLAFIGLLTDPTVIQHLDEEVCKHEGFVETSVSKWEGTLKYASEDLRKNPKIVLKAACFDGASFQYAHESLRSDVDFVVKVIKECRYPERVLATLAESIKQHPQVVAAYLARTGRKKSK